MKPEIKLENYTDPHFIDRSNWLRAAVLGANDGILSVASIAVGVASANAERETIILATLAGLVAGTLSMSSGEYVSVSSQTDIEQADIEREAEELRTMPELELQMLTQIYIERGLKEETAKQVAIELTEKDALAAHVRDELGITDTSRANPIQAALSSAIAFLAGGILPFLVTLFFRSTEWNTGCMRLQSFRSVCWAPCLQRRAVQASEKRWQELRFGVPSQWRFPQESVICSA